MRLPRPPAGYRPIDRQEARLFDVAENRRQGWLLGLRRERGLVPAIDTPPASLAVLVRVLLPGDWDGIDPLPYVQNLDDHELACSLLVDATPARISLDDGTRLYALVEELDAIGALPGVTQMLPGVLNT